MEAIATQTGLVYLRLGSELWVYDAGDPALPVRVGRFSGVSGDLFSAGDFVYAFALGGEPRPLIAIDVSDPGYPVEAGKITYSYFEWLCFFFFMKGRIQHRPACLDRPSPDGGVWPYKTPLRNNQEFIR